MFEKIKNRRLLIRRLLLGAYFMAAFLLFLYLNLPYDGIRSRLEHEVKSRTTLELSISRLTPSFCNLVMRDVVLSDAAGRVLFESPEAHLNVSLFAFLRGILSANIHADAYGGEVFIKLRKAKDHQAFYVDADGLDIGSYGILKDFGIQVTGRLGGNLDMTGESGKARLWLKGLGWRGLKVKGFTVPDLDLEQGWLDAEVKGDRLFIKKFEAEGKELKIRISGDMVMREKGPLNLSIMLKPSERIAREQAGLLSLLKNRDHEGFYKFGVGGTLDTPMPRL